MLFKLYMRTCHTGIVDMKGYHSEQDTSPIPVCDNAAIKRCPAQKRKKKRRQVILGDSRNAEF